MARWYVLLLALASCGRIGFDALDAARSLVPDVVTFP